MKKLLLLAAVVSASVVSIVGVASAKSAGQLTWAMLKVGDLTVKASLDREVVEAEGGATVTLSACDPDITDGLMVVDLYLVHREASGAAGDRKVIRSTRTTFETDCHTHDVALAVGERGKALENYGVFVRVVDSTDSDGFDDGSIVNVANATRREALLSLGKK